MERIDNIRDALNLHRGVDETNAAMFPSCCLPRLFSQLLALRGTVLSAHCMFKVDFHECKTLEALRTVVLYPRAIHTLDITASQI